MSSQIILSGEGGSGGPEGISTQSNGSGQGKVGFRTHRTRKDFDLQENCPFFKLSQELRDMIWIYACTAYRLDSQPYLDDPYDGWVEADTIESAYDTQARRIETALLSTCCRIYQEARRFPVSHNDHVFLNHDNSYEPLDRYKCRSSKPEYYLLRLDSEQRRDAKNFRFIYKYEHLYESYRLITGLNPRNMEVLALQKIEVLTVHIDAYSWIRFQQMSRIIYTPGGVYIPLSVDLRKASEDDVSVTTMRKYAATRYAERGSFAAELQKLVSLRRFNLVLEAFGSRRAELHVVCECAKAWVFEFCKLRNPLPNRQVLKVCEPLQASTDRKLNGKELAVVVKAHNKILKKISEETCVVRSVVTWVASVDEPKDPKSH